jgi:peptidoglycan/LPS O-acetylase OafA/YrhL
VTAVESDIRLFGQLPLFDLSLFLFALALAVHPWIAFVNRGIEWVGVRSFSAYLTHFAALEWTSRLVALPGGWLVNLAAMGILAFALTMGMSALTFWIVERQGQDLGRVLIKRLER